MTALLGLAATLCFVGTLTGWRLLRSESRSTQMMLDEARLEREQGGKPPLHARFMAWLSDQLAPRAVRLLGSQWVERVRQRLDAAGRPHGLTVEGFAGEQAAFVVVGLAGMLLLTLLGATLSGVLVAVGATLWPEIKLSRARGQRQAAIQRDLPDFLDVLAITVRSGMGFRAALARVASTVEGPIAEEITVTLREMELGERRRDAFRRLADRNDSDNLEQFVGALQQAEELGTPLSDALGQIALEMRRDVAQQTRRKAAKTEPKISLVVTLLVLPGTILLIVASMLIGVGFDQIGIGVDG